MPATDTLEDKFEYFYRPYNYTCNTEKYINYEGEFDKGRPDPFQLYAELLEESSGDFLDEYLASVGVTRSRSHT